MAKKSKTPSPFEGRWRIVSMSAWDEDYIDAEEEGFFEFDDKESGEFVRVAAEEHARLFAQPRF